MLRCKFCDSTNLIKYGLKNGRQIYLCLGCDKTQYALDARVKFAKDQVDLAMILYILSSSARISALIFEKIFSKKFSRQTICDWLKKAGLKLSNRNAQDNKFVSLEPIQMKDIKSKIESREIPEGTAILVTTKKSFLVNIKSDSDSSD